MKASRIQLATSAVVAIALAAATFAAPAMADRDHGRDHRRPRYKHAERVVVVPRPQHAVYVRPRVHQMHVGPSFANLVLAGMIGGVHVSARFGDAPYRGYGYWDPYCDVRFMSLRAYRHHSAVHHHPYQLRVFAVAPGHACDRYCDHDCDDDYDYDRTWNRDDGRYDDRDYDDEDWDR